MLKKITVLKCGYLYKKQPNFRFKLSRYKCIIFIHFALHYFLSVGVVSSCGSRLFELLSFLYSRLQQHSNKICTHVFTKKSDFYV